MNCLTDFQFISAMFNNVLDNADSFGRSQFAYMFFFTFYRRIKLSNVVRVNGMSVSLKKFELQTQ